MIGLASERGLDVQFELGRKHGGPITHAEAAELVEEGRAWLDGGAVAAVIEARESAENVGLFDAGGFLNEDLATYLAEGLGLERVVFEAPTKPSQFALLDHLGPRDPSRQRAPRGAAPGRDLPARAAHRRLCG